MALVSDVNGASTRGEAWNSGAVGWRPTARHTSTASVPRSLLTVHDRASQSKAERDPAGCHRPATCRCIFDWGTVKPAEPWKGLGRRLRCVRDPEQYVAGLALDLFEQALPCHVTQGLAHIAA